MASRHRGVPSICGAAFAAMALLPSCGIRDDCGGGAACKCPPSACADLRTTPADDGKTFRLAVGQWASVTLPDRSVEGTATTSDPTVMQLFGKPRKQFVNFAQIYASFQAVKPGTADIAIAYAECPSGTSDPCSYAVTLMVVRFPKADVTVTNVYEQATVRLRVGQSARINAPYEWGAPCSLSIDSPGVIKLLVDPICLQYSQLQAAVGAVAPGSAQLQGCGIFSGPAACANPWHLTFIVT